MGLVLVSGPMFRLRPEEIRCCCTDDDEELASTNEQEATLTRHEL